MTKSKITFKRILVMFLAASFIFSFCFAFCNVFADTKQPRKIRVGFPTLSGFSEIDKNGNFVGHTFEYLQEIAKYTGWEYEFVTTNVGESTDDALSRMMDMLENGDIDILGGILKNDSTEKLFDFPEFNSGVTYATLAVAASNTKYDDLNYASYDNMKVGVLNSAKRRVENLENFASLNEIKLNLEYYDTFDSLDEALYSGRIDALLSSDVTTNEKQRIIVKFATDEYYFATSHGNSDVLKGLNAALEKIKQVDIEYNAKLHEKYFSANTGYAFALMDEEKEYIKNSSKIKVAASKTWAPIQYYNKTNDSMQGISIDILGKITDKTGLQFEIVPYDTYNDAVDAVSRGEAQMMAGVLSDFNIIQDKNLNLSEGYYDMQTVMIKNTSMDIADVDNCILATQNKYTYQKKVKYYETFQESIKAVNSGEADFCYTNVYSAEYYTRNQFYKNITLVNLIKSPGTICIAFAKPTDINLLSIVNKAIHSLSLDEMKTIIYNNAADDKMEVTFGSFLYSNLTEFIIIAFIILFSIGFFIVTFSIVRSRRNRKIYIDRERYKILADISDEFLYEYDIIEDELVLSDKYVVAFKTPKVIKNYIQTIKDDNNKILRPFKDMFLDAFKNIGIDKTFVFQNTFANGELAWFRSFATIIRDKKGVAIKALGKLVCIEKEMQEKEELLEKSKIDQLTGIYNRATCEAEISSYFATKRDDYYCAMMMIDVDHFKSINDNLGHQTGDFVLKDLALTLRTIFKSSDIICRWGGDEFVVFMKDFLDKTIVRKKAEILCNSMNKCFYNEEKSQQISVSVGISIVKNNVAVDELYKTVDRALYFVKENGKNSFKIAE